jgi:hypothetical protein
MNPGPGRPPGRGVKPGPNEVDTASLHPARKYQASTGAVKGSEILWPRPFALTLSLTHPELLHGQSILEVLWTMPLTAHAPGSDRRPSGEGHLVAGPPA